MIRGIVASAARVETYRDLRQKDASPPQDSFGDGETLDRTVTSIV